MICPDRPNTLRRIGQRLTAHILSSLIGWPETRDVTVTVMKYFY